MAKKSSKAADVLHNPPVTSGKYSVTAAWNGETRTLSSDSVAEALLGFGITNIKTKLALTFANSETGRSFTRPYLPRLARRYFTSRPFAEAIGKTITRSLG